MLVVSSFLLYLTCSVVIVYYSQREGLVSTGLVFVICATVYYVAIPVELFLSKSEGYFSNEGVFISLPYAAQALVIFLATLAIVAFMLGYNLSGYRAKPEAFFQSAVPRLFSKNSSVSVSVNFIMFLSLICLLIFFREELSSSISGYELNVATVHLNSSYSYLKFIFTITTSICAFTYLCVRKRNTVGLLLIFLVVAFGIASSDKNPILIGSLPLVCWMCIHGYKKQWFSITATLILVLGFALVLILLPIFSLYRAGVDIFSVDLMERYYFSFTRIDPAGPFISLSEALRDSGPLSFGSTYLKNFAILIPKMLWVNRPLDLGEQFAMDFLSSWSPGQGLGYSLMSEGLVNFGYLGAFLHYFIIGFMWGMVWRIVGCLIKGALYPNIFYRTVGFYLLVLMHRGASLQILKSLLHFLVPLVVIGLIVKMALSSVTTTSRCGSQHMNPVK